MACAYCSELYGAKKASDRIKTAHLFFPWQRFKRGFFLNQKRMLEYTCTGVTEKISSRTVYRLIILINTAERAFCSGQRSSDAHNFVGKSQRSVPAECAVVKSCADVYNTYSEDIEPGVSRISSAIAIRARFRLRTLTLRRTSRSTKQNMHIVLL